MKWTAFDQETAAALSAHVADVALAPAATGELDAALDASAASPAAVLAPAGDRGHTLLITIRGKEAARPESEQPAPEPTSYQAGGFLGLADEPVYDRANHAKRKR